MNWKELEAYGAITIGLICIFLPFILILGGVEFFPDVSSESDQANSICYSIFFIVGIIFLVAGFYDYKKLGSNIIVELTQQTQKVRYCPDCDRNIPWDAQLCPYCGKKF
jgi:hypothetical protein